MKKIILFLFAGLMAVSCQNKDLGMTGIHAKSKPVQVVFDWTGIDQSEIPVVDGMRVNLFSLNDNVNDYGVDDIGYNGGTVLLYNGISYRTLAYTYRGNNIYFRNEANSETIEAYCNAMTRNTYSKSFPQEVTYAEPKGLFYTGENSEFKVVDDGKINITPRNRLYKYTFEVRNVQGAEFISEVRGAISGMSSAFFIGTDQLSPTPSTVLFSASVDKANGRIIGSFRTFGRLDATNNFTIEILYPSNSGGIMQCTWDVTGQIYDNNSFHIIIEDSGINVPDEGGDAASGWVIDLATWNDTDVELN